MTDKVGLTKEKLNEWLQQSRRNREIEDLEICKPYQLELAIQLIQSRTDILNNRLNVAKTRKEIDEKHGKRTHSYNSHIRSLERDHSDLDKLRGIVSAVLMKKMSERANSR